MGCCTVSFAPRLAEVRLLARRCRNDFLALSDDEPSCGGAESLCASGDMSGSLPRGAASNAMRAGQYEDGTVADGRTEGLARCCVAPLLHELLNELRRGQLE